MGIYCNLGPLGDVRGICVYKAFAKWIRVGGGLVYICICLILLVKVGALLLVVVVWVHNRLRTLIFFCTSYFAYCLLSCIFVLYIINSINQACPK